MLFERVARPALGRYDRDSDVMEVIDALISTATTGDAIVVPLKGEPLALVQGRFKQRLFLRGYLMRSRSMNGVLVSWTVKKNIE